MVQKVQISFVIEHNIILVTFLVAQLQQQRNPRYTILRNLINSCVKFVQVTTSRQFLYASGHFVALYALLAIQTQHIITIQIKHHSVDSVFSFAKIGSFPPTVMAVVHLHSIDRDLGNSDFCSDWLKKQDLQALMHWG